MAVSDENGVVSNSLRSDGVTSVHERMKFIAEFERFRERTYMLKHNLQDRMFYPKEDWLLDTPIPRAVGDPPEREAETFMDCLPLDLVLNTLWPKLMESPTAEELKRARFPKQEEECGWVRNFGICCHLRRVCKAWKTFVEERPEWHLGLNAWCEGVHRIPYGETKHPCDSTDSDDTSESGESDDTHSDAE